MLRVTNPVKLAEAAPQSSSQGDTFAVIHVPAAGDFAAALVFNPATQVEAGQTFGTIADEGGWPVVVAMAEEFLGIRIDHIAQLEADALGRVIDELGGLQVCSRAVFSAGGTDYAEGTNNPDGTTSAIFTAVGPVDDAGQTRTRNQRAVARALVKIANRLRTLQTEDLAVVTVPTKSRREEDGRVIIDFDPEALPALKNALTSNGLADFSRYLVSLGY